MAVVTGQTVQAACTDTTILVQAGTAGWDNTAKIYNPNASNALNNVINNCTDAIMTVTLKFNGDTLKMANRIQVTNRANRSTALIGKGVSDSLLTLIDTSTTDPQIINIASLNRTSLSNLGFARKGINQSGSTVLIAADSSSVSGCHFWMADNSSSGTGPLLDITANAVLVEHCLFRAPPEDSGRSVALHTSGSAHRVEIRANVFFSTQLYLTATGAIHVIANTFAGSRNKYNAIIVGNLVNTPEKNINLQHNLFAFKVDTLPPVYFSGTTTSTDSILRNAWSLGKSGLSLAVNSTGAAITLNNTSGAGNTLNVNTPLPKGFSNYGPNSFNVKDYPLTQLRTESNSTLAHKHADFGKIFQAFATSVWTTMSDIKDLPASKLYFPSSTSPFFAGKTWGANIKVGAFVDKDSYEPPMPLVSGARGSALKFSLFPSDSTKILLTLRSFDANYYKTATWVPDIVSYCFSDTLAKLTSSNDTTALKAARAYCLRKRYQVDDTVLSVPREVRNGGDVYVKILHYRGAVQAAVQSDAVIATVSNVPAFPLNDLKLTVVDSLSDFKAGTAAVSVTHGSEVIDSIRVVTATEGGQAVSTVSKPVSGAGALSFPITVATKGTYVFYAVPVAVLAGGTVKAGQATPNSQAIAFKADTSDVVYLTYKTGSCVGADGSPSNAYCSMDSALSEISKRKGTTIVVTRESLPLDTVVIGGADEFPIIITSAIDSATGKYAYRPIFRGNNKEAVSITRKNVTLKGFFIDMPVGSTKTAMSIKASGTLVDGNIFRATASGAVDGVAVNIAAPASAEVRFINNIIWAYAKNIQLTNPTTANIRIMNNTFAEIATLNSGKGIGISSTGPGQASAIVANNFFSGIENPVDVSLDHDSLLTLDHNVFTSKPNLRGINETGLDTSKYELKAADIWNASNYVINLNRELFDAIDCSDLKACNPLYAGSSSATYGTTVANDYLGKARVNKKEVGAYEFDAKPSSVLGILDIVPKLSGNSEKINFVVTAETFDPADGEADSVHVFWSTTNLAGKITASLANIPSTMKKSYPISKLLAGNFSDVADNIKEENTLFYFYAALGRYTGTERKLGYAYSNTITSEGKVDTSTCDFSVSASACPSDGGVFVPTNPAFSSLFKTRITMSEPVKEGDGTFDNPVFSDIANPLYQSLDLTSPIQMMTFNPDIKGLGDSGTKQMFTATITFDGAPSLEGKDLFLIPEDTAAMPSLINTWSIAQADGKTTIVIQSTLNGTQRYAFGKLQGGKLPGIIASTEETPPVFDLIDNKDSTMLHIPVKISGTGFNIANPLMLISVVPAGSSVPDVLSGHYHSSTVVLTNGFNKLENGLKESRFYQYYKKAASAEGISTYTAGQKKPFLMDTALSAENFASATFKDAQDLSIDGGKLGEMTVWLPISRSFKTAENYTPTEGKATRSLEVVYTIFDGEQISRSRSFIRTRFSQADIHLSEDSTYKNSSNSKPVWNLVGYPWNEKSTELSKLFFDAGKWDHDHMRLIQYKGTGSGAEAFDAYEGTNPDVIKFESGRAVWTGSTNAYTPHSLDGNSLDYRPFSLELAANRWNDFSLPFNCAMYWKDILDSSLLTEQSLTAFVYDMSGSAPEWKALSAGSPASSKPGSVLLPWQGFTARPDISVTLKFPVLDTTRSLNGTAAAKMAAKTGAETKAAAEGGVPAWNASVQAYSGTASMSLLIGKGGQEYRFGEAPNIPGQDFRIALKRPTPTGEEKVSQLIQTDEGDWQGHWALATEADKSAKGISLRISQSTRNIPLYLVDVLHKSAAPLSAETPIQISGEELRTNDYQIVAGSSEYLKSVLNGLAPLHLLALSNYPNPFAGATLIRYALPESFGEISYELKVRDFRGRTVWEKTIKGGNALSYSWDGRDRLNSPLPAGVYTLSLEAAAVGKPVFKANRRILKL
ncbi:MAG: hypothetical protein ABI036_17995 [Fibrobacteria bacterium]